VSRGCAHQGPAETAVGSDDEGCRAVDSISGSGSNMQGLGADVVGYAVGVTRQGGVSSPVDEFSHRYRSVSVGAALGGAVAALLRGVIPIAVVAASAQARTMAQRTWSKAPWTAV
jgi:hypothetical protein